MAIVDFSPLNKLNDIIDYTLDGDFSVGGGINSIAQSCLDYIASKYNIDIKPQVRINVRNYWKNILDNVGVDSITVQEIGDKTLSFLSLDDIFKKDLIKEDGNKKILEYTPGNDGYNIKITNEKGITSNISNPETPSQTSNIDDRGENPPVTPPTFSDNRENNKNEPIPITEKEEKPTRKQEDNTDLTNLINSRTADLDNKIKTISDTISDLTNSVTKKIDDISETVDKTIDSVIDSVKNTVENIVDSVDDKISNIAGTILDITKGIIDSISNSYDKLVSGITDIFSAIYDSISEEIKNVLSFLSGIITAIYDFIASLLDILKKAIDYLFEQLTKFMTISDDDIKSAMNTTMEFIKNNILTPNLVNNLKPV